MFQQSLLVHLPMPPKWAKLNIVWHAVTFSVQWRLQKWWDLFSDSNWALLSVFLSSWLSLWSPHILSVWTMALWFPAVITCHLLTSSVCVARILWAALWNPKCLLHCPLLQYPPSSLCYQYRELLCLCVRVCRWMGRGTLWYWLHVFNHTRWGTVNQIPILFEAYL